MPAPCVERMVTMFRLLNTVQSVGSSIVRAVIEQMDHIEPPNTPSEPPAKRVPPETTDALFAQLGNLGDPDGLGAQHDQRKTDSRNMAALLASFYANLHERGVPDSVAGDLVQMYYGHVLDEDEVDQIIFDMDEDD